MKSGADQERPSRVSRSWEERLSLPHPGVIVKLCNRGARQDVVHSIGVMGAGLPGTLDPPGTTLELRPLFTSVEAEEIDSLQDRAVRLDPGYRAPDLLTYYWLHGRRPSNRGEMDRLTRVFQEGDQVELAYFSTALLPAETSVSPDARIAGSGAIEPGHLGPTGIDLPRPDQGSRTQDCDWSGEGIRFICLEQGWKLDHRALPRYLNRPEALDGTNWGFKAHGTRSLGVVLAQGEDDTGCVGIAPKAEASVVSVWREGVYNPADAILAAAAKLRFGDVLYLGLQLADLRPLEAEAAIFDAIRLATALGIVVVEPAGNGAIDLDVTLGEGVGAEIAGSTARIIRGDSGAIVVGAAKSSSLCRLGTSNFGARLDCFAWGEKISTLNCDGRGEEDLVTDDFSETSGAAAIVAGAALAVQSAELSRRGHPRSPMHLRSTLSDPTLGTPSESPGVDRLGIMPNVRRILEN